MTYGNRPCFSLSHSLTFYPSLSLFYHASFFPFHISNFTFVGVDSNCSVPFLWHLFFVDCISRPYFETWQWYVWFVKLLQGFFGRVNTKEPTVIVQSDTHPNANHFYTKIAWMRGYTFDSADVCLSGFWTAFSISGHPCPKSELSISMTQKQSLLSEVESNCHPSLKSRID